MAKISLNKQLGNSTSTILDPNIPERQSFIPLAKERGRTFSQATFCFVALVFFQVLLALSFRFAQRELSGQYPFSSSALLVTSETTKLGISLCLFFQEKSNIRFNPLSQDAASKQGFETMHHSLLHLKEQLSWRLLRSTALLAALYCINNHITFLVYGLADGANIILIKSGSSFVSALMLRFALGRAISRVQWSAIFLQIFGLVVAQLGATCSDTPLLPVYVYFLLFMSLVISSMSGVWNDYILKADNGQSMHMINMLIYAFGFIMNGISYVWNADPDQHFFLGFDNPSTYLVLLCQSLFGVSVSAVYKFADATVKTFALSCATSILLVVNVLGFGLPFNLVAAMGCATVFVATHLYVSHPPLAAATAKSIKMLSVMDDIKTHR